MTGKTHYWSQKCLSLIGGASVTGVTTTWIALLTANPTGDGEAATDCPGLTRTQVYTSGSTVPYWSAVKSEGDKKLIDNVGTVSWFAGTAESGWTQEIIVGIGIYDAATVGNLLYWEALDANITIAPEEELAFGTGAIKVRED